jgi:hypothetical protein
VESSDITKLNIAASKQYIFIHKIILKFLKLLTLPDDEPVKRAPAGSGRADGVGDGGRGSGGRGLRRGGSGGVGLRRGGFGGVVLGLRVGAGGEVVGHGLCLGGGAWRRRRRSHGDGVTAAAAAWVHMAARVRMKRCALGRRRLNLLIFDGAQEAVGHKIMSDGC